MLKFKINFNYMLPPPILSNIDLPLESSRGALTYIVVRCFAKY